MAIDEILVGMHYYRRNLIPQRGGCLYYILYRYIYL